MSLPTFVTKTIAFAVQAGKDIKEIRGWIGNLTNLNTTIKNNLVGAINEIKALILTVQQNQGNYIPTSQKGTSGGVAELDSGGKVPASQLPSFVDDVLEGFYISPTVFNDETGTAYPNVGGKAYVDISNDNNKKGSYRWSGTQYTKIEQGGIVLGETSDTAYRGDRGKLAYDHISKTDNPHQVTATQVGLGNVPNHSYATTTVANAGTSTAAFMNPKLTKDAVDSWVGDADPHQEYLNNL